MAEVVAGTATATVTAKEMEATMMTVGGWEDTPATQGIGQYRGQYPPRAAVGRVPGVPPPWGRQRRDRGLGRGQGQDRD